MRATTSQALATFIHENPVTSQPFKYDGPPPPDGYGLQIMSQGDRMTSKNLICQACGALVPDEIFFKEAHDKHRRQKLLLETVENLVAEVGKLRSQYLIQEES